MLPARLTLSIRSWLMLLVMASILPTLGGIAFILADLFHREELRAELVRIETARALMQAVDREFSRAEGILRTLASSSSLQDGDLSAFYLQAKAIQANYPDNIFVLSDGSGQQLINTLRPYGAALPLHANPSQLHAVFASGHSVISDLYFGGVTRKPVISIDVPVLRNERVIFDLSMGFLPTQFYEVLHAQRVSPDIVAAIFDSRGVIVARTWEQDKYVGRAGAAELIRRIGEVTEDSIETSTLEGIPVVTAFSRSSISRWSVAIGVPRSVVLSARWASLSWLVGGVALALLIAMALTALVGERIAAPIRRLRPHAKALGEGITTARMTTYIKEVNDVAHELDTAARLVRIRTVERDRAEQAERDLREAQDRLQRNESFLSRLFDEAPDAMLLVDITGRIVRASLAAEKIFGYANEQLLSMQVEDLVPARMAAHHVTLRGSYFAAPVSRAMGADQELAACRADGGEFPVEVSLSSFGEGNSRMALATVRDVTQIRRDKATLKTALAEKETLLRELYHRVKNNLQVIASMIRMQQRTSSELVRIALEDTANRVRAMALVHEKLYQTDDLTSIALDAYLTDLCKQLGEAAGASQRGIVIECQVNAVAAGLDAAIPLGLIITELVSNCLKHAFAGRHQGRIQVRIERSATHLCLTVEDDGQGMDASRALAGPYSLGLRIIEAISRQLDGEFSIRSNGGTVAQLVCPWPYPAPPHKTRGSSP